MWNMQELSLRDLYDGYFYHICTEGLEQVTIMRDLEDFRVAWNYLAICAWRTGAFVVAFVLMSNHLHILAACRNAGQVNKYIRSFKALYSRYLNKKYGMTKTMNSSDTAIYRIDTIQYLRNCIAYIFRNPLTARICSRLDQYSWSSFHSCFSGVGKLEDGFPLCELSFTEIRKLLRVGANLKNCPLRVDPQGYITLSSFVHNDIVEKVFGNSGRSFMYHLGGGNDAKMEYELVHQPLVSVTDSDMYSLVSTYVANRFSGKHISDLTSSDKCSILKSLFFNHKTSIPQLARIMGLPRELVKKMLQQ